VRRRPDELFRKVTAREEGWAWLGWLLTPFSLVYGCCSLLRRKLFESGLIRREKLPVTVVSIGNIEVGGVGKTPVTIWLARKLLDLGIRVAVVARNLDAARGEPLAIRPGMGSDRLFSDEILMLGARLGGKCAVYAGASKLAAARRAVREADPEVILIDDGFQHLKLYRDIDVVVLDHQHPTGIGGLLPAGTLREFPGTLACADYLWVNRSAQGMSKSFTKRKIAAHNWQAPFIFSQPVPSPPRNLLGNRPDEAITDVVAFCGIARPADFGRTLEEAGYRVLELVPFPDHYRYREEDMKQLSATVRKTGAHCLMTTEKDAMKLTAAWSSMYSVFMLPIELEVEGDIDSLLGSIIDRMKEKSQLL